MPRNKPKGWRGNRRGHAKAARLAQVRKRINKIYASMLREEVDMSEKEVAKHLRMRRI